MEMNKGKQRKTTEAFINDAHKIHGDKYNYTKVEYINTHTKVCVICPEHGEFWITPANHLKMRGCPICGKRKNAENRRKNTENFIQEAIKVHGEKYDYSKTDYKSAREKVCIVCPEHGEFWRTPDAHLRGAGCPKCPSTRKYNTNKIDKQTSKKLFINLAKDRYGDKYDYSKTDYVNRTTEVIIICPEHGEFTKRPSDFLRGRECPKCAKNHCLSVEEFIDKSRQIHGNKYDYSKVEYKNAYTKVCIICPEHGEFWQYPHKHLKGNGCLKCLSEKLSKERRLTNEEFIERSSIIHDNKYGYQNVNYINCETKVCIICPNHGEFWQKPLYHLKGCGCPMCRESKLENKIRSFLTENNIKFEEQKTFEWLRDKGKLRLDFYLPEYNAAIECQGEQHFEPVDFSGYGEEWAKSQLEKIKHRDNLKKKLCEEHGINIIYLKNIGTNTDIKFTII